MSKPTKIILDKQSDLILNNARIVGATGIVKSDLPGLVSDLASLDTAIKTEATDRSAAIQAEAGARAAEIASERARIDAILSGSDVDLDQFREVVAFVRSIDLANDTDLLAKVTEINVKITAEETARIAADAALTAELATLQSYVDTTVNDAISQLTADLQAETDARVDADATLSATFSAAIAAEAMSRVEADVAEETRALAAEAALQAAIDAEAAARIADVGTIDGKIADIISNTDLTSIDSFTEVVTNLDAEIARALAAEASLDAAKLNLAGGDMSGDINMANNMLGAMVVTTNFLGATVGDLIRLESSLDFDDSRSIINLPAPTNGGDATNKLYVDSTLSSEATSRIEGDANLQSTIDALAQTVNTNITDTINGETAARIAGDQYIQSTIDALAMTDGETIDVDQVQNVIRLKEVVAAPDSGVRTFEGDIKVGAQPDTKGSYDDLSLITKGILDARVSSEVSTINTSISDEVSRAQNAESTLQSNIDVEKFRIDAILDASEADKDSFAEIVQLINSVDTTNDTAFASYVLSNDARLTAEEQERARIAGILGDGVVNEQIAREDADAVIQHEIDTLPTTDGETIEVNPVDNTLRLKEVVDAPDSGYRTFRGDVKADSQPSTLPSFNDLSFITKLYVDEKVGNDLTDGLQAEEDARTQADAALQSLLDAEVARAIAADSVLTSDLSTEAARAIAAEGVLTSDLSTEVAARILADSTLESNINYELQSLSTTLTSNLSDETAARIADVDAEEARATAAEGVLQSNIDVEKGRIDAILDGSTVDLDQFAEVVAFVQSIDMSNDESLLNAYATFSAAMTAEVAARIADVDAEEARAIAAELVLTNNLSSEVSSRIAAEAALSATFSVALSAEESARIAGDAQLSSDLDNLQTYVDTTVNTAITTLTSDLSDETAARIAADAALSATFSSALSAEESARIADVDAEEARAIAAELVLTSDLSTEAARAIAAESALSATFSAAINVEKGRIDAILAGSDVNLDQFAEVVAFVQAIDMTNDESLLSVYATFSAAMTAEVDARIDAVSTEEAARIAGDAQLSSDLADLQSYVDTTVNTAITTLTSDLDAEVLARIADVDAEEARAIAAEGVLQTNINTDANERSAEDITLQGNISAESTRAQAAETAIASDLGTETAARIAAVSAEEARAIAAEGVLTSDLSTESTRAVAAEGVLQSNIDVEKSRIDAILIGASASADNFAEIVALINSVDTTNDTAYASYVLSNDAALAAEVAARISSDAALSATFSAEAARAIAAEGVLTSDLSTESARAIAAEGVLTSALSAEEASRIAGDASLQASLNNEISDRIAAGQSAQAALDTESARAIAAEGVLTSALSAEVSRATAKEDLLEAALSGEINGRVAGDAALSATFSAAISAESARAIAAEAALSATFSAALAEEHAHHTAAEGVLQSNIDVEKSRIDAILIGASASADNFAEIVALINSVDTTNDTAYASYVLSNDAALAAEVAARISSDAAFSATFSAAMSAETARAIAAEAVLASDLSTESARAIAAEAAFSATFSAAISTESARAIAAEAALASDFANIYSKKVVVFGTASGVLTTFTLELPVRIGSEMIYVNGLLMEEGEDYTTIVASGKVSGVEFLYAPSTEMKVRAYGVCGVTSSWNGSISGY